MVCGGRVAWIVGVGDERDVWEKRVDVLGCSVCRSAVGDDDCVPDGLVREMLQAAIDKSQEHVSGSVRMKLYKGNATVIGRESEHSLYDQDLVTFEEGAVAYDHRDAAGFIRLNALRLRTLGQRKKKLKL